MSGYQDIPTPAGNRTTANMVQAVAFPVGKEIEITSRAMQALSNPVRLQIVKHLSSEELSVKELTDRIRTHSQSSISQHLGFLFKNGIICNRHQGTLHLYRIADRRTDILIRMIMVTFCPVSGSQPSTNGRAAGAFSAA